MCLLLWYDTVSMKWQNLTEIRYHTASSKQRMAVATVTHAAVEELLEVVFSVGVNYSCSAIINCSCEF
jgi:hypothetical protein